VITVLDNTTWAQADLDGNSAFIEVIGPGSPPQESLFVVSNNRADNSFIILESSLGAGSPPVELLGSSFTVVAEYVFPYAAGTPPFPNQEFAPCVAYDPIAGVIHIVGLRNNLTNPRFFDFIKFQYNVATGVLTGPTVLATTSLIRSGYDIIVLGNSDTVIGVILTDATTIGSPPEMPGQSLVIFELDPNDNLVSVTQLLNSPDNSSSTASLITYNSLSLASPDGVNVELYWEQHPRLITFKDQLFQIFFALRSGGVWNLPGNPIESFVGRYSDDRLTVLQDTQGGRYLAQIFYTQTNIPEGITGNLLLGYLQGGGSWIFQIVKGSLNGSIVEATLSLDQAGNVFVAYLIEDLLTGQVGGPTYPMQLASVNLANLAVTNLPGWYNNHNFTWLRGTKSIVDDLSMWAVVAEEQVGGSPTIDTPSYLSGIHTPPVAVLSPASVVVERGTPQFFDASASYDTTEDPITYNWSETSPDLVDVTLAPNGDTAILNVARAIGGGQRIFDVTVEETTSYYPTPENGSIASSLVTVPFDPPSYVEFLGLAFLGSPPIPTIYAARNTSVTITPTYFPEPPNADALMSYTWTQTMGDMVEPLSFSTPTFTFPTNGLSVNGETLMFTVQVNDGVTTTWSSATNYSIGDSAIYNNAVYTAQEANTNVLPPNSPTVWSFIGFNLATVQVIVASYEEQNPSYIPNTLRLARAIWQTGGSPPSNATISQRNSLVPSYSSLSVSGVWSNLQNIKRISVISGQNRELIISPASALVYGGVAPNVVLLTRCLTPLGTPILDAFHTEQDYTLVLTLDGNPATYKIYRYMTAYHVDTDNPDAFIDLSTIVPEMAFNTITATIVYNNVRVIALSGLNGCLLLQVNSQTLTPEGFTVFSVESKRLYGADNVQWVRMANVESVNSGLILIGSIQIVGNPPVSSTYETFYDLPSGTILGVWDKTKLVNQIVNTGEILFEAISTYGGFPATPTMGVPTLIDGVVTLSWSEVNPSSIDGYEIFYSSDGVSYSSFQVGSGAIQSIQIPLSQL
jgi:hypothetical protein